MATYRLDQCNIIIDIINPLTNTVRNTKKYNNQSIYINDYHDSKVPTINLFNGPNTKSIEYQLDQQGYTLYSNFAITHGKLSIKLTQPYNCQYNIQVNNFNEQLQQLKYFIHCCITKKSIVNDRKLRDITNIINNTPNKSNNNNKQLGTAKSITSSKPSPNTIKRNTTNKSQLINSLNKASGQQRDVLDAVYSGKNIFFTGAAGCGKSYLLNEIVTNIQYILHNNKSVAITSTTGITATQLSGTTIQSWTGVYSTERGIDQDLRRIRNNRDLYNKWNNTQILIIDEISLLSGSLFDYYEQLARLIRNNNKLFGGIQLVICGDFYQLPAIFKSNESPSYIFESIIFNQCMTHKIQLTQIYRQQDQTFIDLLNQIRVGECTAETEQTLKLRENTVLDTSDGILPTQLMVKKINVEQINQNKIQQLSGDAHQHNASDTGAIDLISSNCIAASLLELKIGAQVILVKNVDLSVGLANGSRGVVVRYTSNNLPVVKFSTGTHTIGLHTFNILQNNRTVATRTQIPLLLGWAITVHKSQGMTLDKCIIDLNGVFECGMTYVALSRVRSLNGLVLINFNKQYVKANPKVRLYYDAFDDINDNDNNNTVVQTPSKLIHLGTKPLRSTSTPSKHSSRNDGVTKQLTSAFRTPMKSPDSKPEPKRNRLMNIR